MSGVTAATGVAVNAATRELFIKSGTLGRVWKASIGADGSLGSAQIVTENFGDSVMRLQFDVVGNLYGITTNGVPRLRRLPGGAEPVQDWQLGTDGTGATGAIAIESSWSSSTRLFHTVGTKLRSVPVQNFSPGGYSNYTTVGTVCGSARSLVYRQSTGQLLAAVDTSVQWVSTTNGSCTPVAGGTGFVDPQGVAWDEAGQRIFVSDSGPGQLFVIVNGTKTLLESGLANPAAIAYDSGFVFVAEPAADRVSVYSTGGEVSTFTPTWTPVSPSRTPTRTPSGPPTPTPTRTATATPTLTPGTPPPTRVCTPPPCGAGQVLWCPSGSCPGGCGYTCATPTPTFVAGDVVADSVADFSGTQGQKNWYYGYMSEADRWTFHEMPSFEDGTWTVDWAHYWTSITATTARPNGSMPGGGKSYLDEVTHYAVRRWVSNISGLVMISGHVAKKDTRCGNGIRAKVRVAGIVNLFDEHVDFNDGVGLDFSVFATLSPGSVVDLLLGPEMDNDRCDETEFTAIIRTVDTIPPTPTPRDPCTGTGTRITDALALCSDQTWTKAGSPYYIKTGLRLGDTNCPGGSAPRLVIEPGVEVCFDDGKAIDILNGTFKAQGTVDQPILFTSTNVPRTQHYWQGLRFLSGTVPGSVMEHCIVEYGDSAAGTGVVGVKSTAVALNHLTVRYSAANSVALGIDVSGSIQVNSPEVYSNLGHGISVYGGTTATIAGGTVAFNGNDGINCGGYSTCNIVGAVIGGNGRSGIVCSSDRVHTCNVNDACIGNCQRWIVGGGIGGNAQDGVRLWGGVKGHVWHSQVRNNGGDGIDIGPPYEYVKIEGNVVFGNCIARNDLPGGQGTAVNLYSGSASLNTIVGHKGTALWIQNNSTVTENNLEGNAGYTLRYAVANTQPDLNASGNWWGATDTTLKWGPSDTTTLGDKIEDCSEMPGTLGCVRYNPAAPGPIVGAPTGGPCARFTAEVPPDRWKGEYWNNMSLNGWPRMTRDDGSGFLDFDWGAGSPALNRGISDNYISARWTRTVSFPADGPYELTLETNDGARLFVDDALVPGLDQWRPGARTYVALLDLKTGEHRLRVEYFEKDGPAVLKLSWRFMGATATPSPTPTRTPTWTPTRTATVTATVSPTVTGATPTRTPTPENAVSISDCAGMPGGTALCAVVLRLSGGTEVATLQFNMTVEAVAPAPALVAQAGFVADAGLPTPSMIQNDGFSTVLVGWLSAMSPRLSGTRTLGRLTVPLPSGAQAGQRYRLRVVNPSATADGSIEVPIGSGADGTLTVGASFLVCDVAPVGGDLNSDGDSFDAGEFGNATLSNADVVAIFRASLLPGQLPPASSDFFSAMDSFTEDGPPTCGGDGRIVNNDVVSCFRRSLVTTLPRYQRLRDGTACASSTVGSGGGGGSETEGAVPARAVVAAGAQGSIQAGQVQGLPGEAVEVPIVLTLDPEVMLATVQFNVTVHPAGAATLPEGPVVFVRNPALADLSLNLPEGDQTVLIGWLSPFTPALSGSVQLGVVRVSLPAEAAEGDQYEVAVVNPSATSDGTNDLVLDGLAGRIDVVLPMVTATPSPTDTALATPTPTATDTSTHRPTSTATITPSPSKTDTSTATSTPSPSATGTATATETETPTPTVSPAPVCTGDCDGNGQVTVDELIKGVNIALGSAAIGECAAFDRDGSGTVTIDELIAGVNRALEGC